MATAKLQESNLDEQQIRQAVKEFCKLYYESFDKKRHQMRKLYHADARLVWNGNPKTGPIAIMEFLDSLPSSNTKVSSLDSQPVLNPAKEGEQSLMVTVLGTVDFLTECEIHVFHQSFLLTSEGDAWKITSDIFRYLE